MRIKDYKAGDVKHEPFAGEEFVRRFAMHILPRGMAQVHYAGILRAVGDL